MTDTVTVVVGLGRVLRRRRKQHGVSIAQLAVTAGGRPNTISDIENDHGNPELLTLTKIAEALALTVPAIFADVFLTDDEADLLDAYRSLSATSKKLVLAWVSSLAEHKQSVTT